VTVAVGSLERLPSTLRPGAGLRPEIAGAMGLGGLMLGLVGMGLGSLGAGVLGLLVIGTALGFVGTVRSRIVVAIVIWLAATVFAIVAATTGSVGLALAGPLVFVLTCVALGQCVGVIGGVARRRSGGTA
jgi:hypothetical protein